MRKVQVKLKVIAFALAALLSLPVTGAWFTDEPIQVQADSGKGLAVNEESAEEVGALGFSTEQPLKETPSGKTVDKEETNPLGAAVSTKNRISGLAVAGISAVDGGLIAAYKTPFTSTYLNMSSDNIISPYASKNLSSLKKVAEYAAYQRIKAMTSADLDGDLKQEAITAVLLPDLSGNVKLGIMIRSYSVDGDKNSTGYTDTQIVISDSFTPPASTNNAKIDYPFEIVSGDFDQDGKDEIVVCVDKTVYFCKINKNGTVVKQSQYTFKMPSSPQYGDRIGITAADADKDGFDELLLSTGSSTDSHGVACPYLLIYDNTDTLYTTWKSIPLSFKDGGDMVYLVNPSVDVGDVYGDGEQYITIGGKGSNGKIYLATSLYDAKKEKYSELQNSHYTVGVKGTTKSNMWGIISKEMGLKCVSLTGPVAGKPEYVVLGGSIFQYNKDDMQFVKAAYMDESYKDSGKTSNNTDGILGITCDGDGVGGDDAAYVMNTLAGNFDGNMQGKEQVVMLHCNITGGTYAEIFITWLGADEKGKLITHMKRIWNPKMDYYNIDIADVDVYNNSTTLTYLPEKSEFTFTTPTVIAVIGASPFYQELADRSTAYANALGNGSTSFGKGAEVGNSSSKGVDIHAGVSFGFHNEQDLLGIITLDEVNFKVEITNSFTKTYTDSLSISKSVTYINNLIDKSDDSADKSGDSVVIMATPYDIYHYKVTGPDGKEEEEITINVPYEPMIQQMPVEDYNKIITEKNMTNAPIITDEVLNHTVGDPRTYPKSMNEIKGAAGYLLSDEFAPTGRGTTNTREQAIAVTKGSENSFDYNLDVTATLEVTVFVATAGVSAGVGYVSSDVTSNSLSTTSSGSVAGIPVEYTNYGFKWQLALYNYNLKLNGSDDRTQPCYVVSYLVQPGGSEYPPRMPENLTARAQSTEEVYLSWDKVENSAGYIVSRSAEKNGSYTDIQKIAGNNTTGYVDNKNVKGKTYYYKVRAYNSSEGLASEPVKGSALYVRALSVDSVPRLSYIPGENLDLSGLSLKLTFSDDSIKVISYKDFADYGLKAEIEDGTVLAAADDGRKLMVSLDSGTGSTVTAVSAGKLTVYAVKSLEISSPPLLYYTEGDALNLTGLSVTFLFANNTRKTVAYKDFADNSLTVSKKDGELLGAKDDGTGLTVTYKPDKNTAAMEIKTELLAVYAKGDNDVLLSAEFTVGDVNKATSFKAGQKLTAKITAVNNQDIAQNALVILALYDDGGSMVGYSCGSVGLKPHSDGNSSKELTLSITLPAGTNSSYQLKVFAWEGTDVNETNQTPISNVIVLQS